LCCFVCPTPLRPCGAGAFFRFLFPNIHKNADKSTKIYKSYHRKNYYVTKRFFLLFKKTILIKIAKLKHKYTENKNILKGGGQEIKTLA
jgi:hypothetical protein